MNILMVTPVYRIEGRETLERNTEAIHYLIKYWQFEPDVHVHVINTYLNPGRKMRFLLKKGEWKRYRTPYDYIAEGINVHLTEIQQIPFQNRFWKFQNRKIQAALDEVIEKKGFRPDIMIMHFPVRYTGALALLEGKYADIPKVAVMHYTDLWISKKHPQQLERINAQFDVVLARSRSILNECKKMGFGNLSDFVVSSGVPYAKTTRKTPISFAADLPIKILYVGKLIKRKHLDYVIQTLGKLRNSYKFTLEIIGTGPEKDNYMSLVRSNEIAPQTCFIDAMPRSEVYQHMSSADIFIMPSVEETLGLVYLEAMMNGCITVGTEGEGIDGIIRHGVNGFLVKPLDADSVEETLRSIFDLPDDKLQQISENAMQTSRVYNEKDMSLRYLQKIKEILDGKETKK